MIIFVIFGGFGSSDHQNSSTDINVKSNSTSSELSSNQINDWDEILNTKGSSSDYSSTRNPSTYVSNSQQSNVGYQEIVIENMVLEDNQNLANRAGFGYIGTLIPKGKNYIIKLDEYDWKEIMRQTNGNPIGKTIYADIQHDEFEEKWDGDNFYYIEDFY